MKNVLFILLILSFVACTNDKSQKLENTDVLGVAGHSIFNLSIMYTDNERLISFPVFFNDSILEQRNIRSIERVQYFIVNDSIDGEQRSTSADKTILYGFDKSGLIQSMRITNSYDFKTINSVLVEFKNQDPNTGFSFTRLKEATSSYDFPYRRHELVDETNKMHAYEDVQKGNKLFVIPNQKNWKTLVIDTLCRPSSEDLIVWGSLKYPAKIYQVSNLVEESNVRTFKYVAGVLRSATWTDDPFTVKRTFLYNDKGTCKGFVDSTFSLGGFVSGAKYQFILNNELPVVVEKYIFSGNSQRFIFRETFHYSENLKN